MPNATVILYWQAAREYRSAYRWYVRRSGNAARRFQREFGHTITRIARTPHAGIPFRVHYRWARLRHFPYILYYEVETDERVVVYAVAHERRRAGYWLGRTR